MAYIITMIALVLAGIFALLVKVWTGFMYFVLAVLACLAVYWGVYKIFKYFSEFKERLEKEFTLFKAQTINANRLTVEQFDANEPAYRKEFGKKSFKDRFLYWAVIIFCFALAVSFVVAMILL